MGRYCCHSGFSCLVWFNFQSHFFKSFIMIITIITLITVKIQKSVLLMKTLSFLPVTFNVPEKSIRV